MEKEYKNKNMIRTKHNVGRIVEFNNPEERDRFLALYEDIFDSVNRNDNNGCCIGGMITKKSFDEIVKSCGLVSIHKYGKKTRYWKFESET